MKKYIFGGSLTLLTLGLTIMVILYDRKHPRDGQTLIYDDQISSHAEPNIKRKSMMDPQTSSVSAGHAASDPKYYSYFANFTTRLKFIDSPDLDWAGKWKDSSLLRSDTITKLRTNEGPSLAKFSFQPEIHKSWMNITIQEGPYFDSNSLHLSINLKMSQYEKNSSTFTINCNQWDEYFANGTLVEDFYKLTPKNFFDMAFQLTLTSRLTGKPLDLDNFNQDDVLITYTLKSIMLGLNLKAEMVYASKSVYNSLIGFVVFIGILIMFFVSWSQNYTYEPAFIQNMGFEVAAILMLLYFHFFCISYEIFWMTKDHSLFLLGTTLITMFFNFFWLIETIHFLSVDDMLRRHRPDRRRGELYSCLTFTAVMIIQVFLAVFSRKLMMTPAHKYFLIAFFAYPILQIVITLIRAVNKNVFKFGYHIFNWWPPLLFVALIRGGLLEEYFNLTPWELMVPITGGLLFFGTFIMYLQNRIGVYFFLPGFIIPKAKDLVVPISQVPQEKMDDVCSICYFKITTDPEQAAVELQEVEQDQDRSAASESMLPKVSEVMKLECNHFFHIPCLKAWLSTKQTCPVCNKAVVYYDF